MESNAGPWGGGRLAKRNVGNSAGAVEYAQSGAASAAEGCYAFKNVHSAGDFEDVGAHRRLSFTGNDDGRLGLVFGPRWPAAGAADHLYGGPIVTGGWCYYSVGFGGGRGGGGWRGGGATVVAVDFFGGLAFAGVEGVVKEGGGLGRWCWRRRRVVEEFLGLMELGKHWVGMIILLLLYIVSLHLLFPYFFLVFSEGGLISGV